MFSLSLYNIYVSEVQLTAVLINAFVISNLTEKARIEAELEAAQAASKRAEIEFKKQLEKEREAARAAIDKV